MEIQYSMIEVFMLALTTVTLVMTGLLAAAACGIRYEMRYGETTPQWRIIFAVIAATLANVYGMFLVTGEVAYLRLFYSAGVVVDVWFLGFAFYLSWKLKKPHETWKARVEEFLSGVKLDVIVFGSLILAAEVVHGLLMG